MLRPVCNLVFAALLFALLGACSSGGGSATADPGSTGIIPPTPPAPPVPDPTGPPNVLLIIADDLGLDALAAYPAGSESPHTPTLDTLAADGLVFDNLWVNPLCSPTRATLLTGRYGFRTGVLAPGDELSVSEQSVQSYLSANTPTPYSNAVIGKWHLGGDAGAADHPNQLGVSYFAGLAARGGVGDYYNWEQTINGVSSTNNTYITSALVDLSVAWIGQQDTPWFLWLAFNAPHTPFHLPPQDLHSQNLNGEQTDIYANPRDYYFAMIEAMDTEIGRLLASLGSEDRANTVVFFIGDNGTPMRASQAPFGRSRAKGSIYEGGIHTPMIAQGPAVRAGEREGALINGTDFFATIAALAGIDVATINDSVSFANVLGDASATGRDYVYSEVVPDLPDPSAWAIRDLRYKLIQFADGRQELYDVANDPYEAVELIASGADVAQIIQGLEAQAGEFR